MIDPDQVNEGNPFPGLRPFEMEEYHLFFGRDGQSDEVVKRLRDSRFVAVVGTSGSGKSSLIRAGLLPAIYGGLMAGTGSLWRVVVMRPGHDPLGNLAYELGQGGVLTENPDPEIQDTLVETTLRRSTLGLVDAVRQARMSPGENVLVVVDQFEELFRFKEATKHTTSSDDAAHFVKLLIAASAQKQVPIYVVLTMRSDFLGDCSQFEGLPEAINKSQYLIPRMTRDEREAAIRGPIKVGEGEITVPLVNRLLNDIGDNPDQLPILQHALMRTWNYWSEHRRNGDPIGLDDYEGIGTMASALSSHANEALADLKNERSISIAEKLFKRLCEKGTDNRELRRPTQMGEICAVAEATLAEVAAVVDVFRRKGRSFLMPPEGQELTVDTIVDISHESLIRVWDKLKEWTASESDSARMYRRLSAATTDFGTSYLPDSLLDAALEWRKIHKPNAAWAERYRSDSENDPSFEEVMSFVDRSKATRDKNREMAKRAAEEQKKRLLHEKEQAEIVAKQEREIAETQRKIADTEREIAANQSQIAASERERAEQAQLLAETQARAARKLRFLVGALAFMLVITLAAGALAYKSSVRANNASKEAKVSEEKALAAKKEAEEQRNRAEYERGKAQNSADEANEANERLRSTVEERENALRLARTAQAANRKKDAEKARLLQKELHVRDANEDFRKASAEKNDEKAAGDLLKTGQRLEQLDDLKGAGDSYLQSATRRASIPTATESEIVETFDHAIKNFQALSNAKEAKERTKERQAAALVAKGEYLILWRPLNSGPDQRFNLGIQSLEDALKIYEDLGNLDASISTLRSISTGSKNHGDTKKSVDALNRMRKFHTAKKDWTQLTNLLFELATADEPNKTQYLDEALKVSKQHNNSATNFQMVMDVAQFYLFRVVVSDDDLERAIRLYEQALKAVSGDNEEASILSTIATQLRSSTNAKAKNSAGNYYKRALDIYLRLKDPDSAGNILTIFVSGSDGYEALKLWPEAFDYMERYLDLLDSKAKAYFLVQIGAARKSTGQPPLALEAFERAAAIFLQFNDVGKDEAFTRMEIGTLQVELNKSPAEALQSFTRAQQLYHAENAPNPCFAQYYVQEADAFKNIGNLQEKLTQLPAAVDSYTQARDLYRKAFIEAQGKEMDDKIQEIQKRLAKP